MSDSRYEFDGVEMPPPAPKHNEEENEQFVPLKPSNWLWQSVLVTLCCFPVFGIIGIVNAMQVNPHYYAGNYERADRFSKRARLWSMVGLIAGIVYFIVALITMTKGNFMEQFNDIISDGVYSIYNY